MRKIFTLIFVLFSITTFALDPNHFTITRITAPYFIADGGGRSTYNQCYTGFEIKNTGNTTYSKLRFSIASIESAIASQTYTVSYPTDRIINIGTLAPGESKVCYFYISYPVDVTAQGTFKVILSDNTPASKAQSFIISNRSSNSANGSGTPTQVVTSENQIGALLVADITYNTGNVRPGYETDFQASVSAQFDPRKLILSSTKVISSTVPGIPVGATDSLYFLANGRVDGTSITIRWIFRIAGYSFTNPLLPCLGMTNGSAYKYSLNTDAISGTPLTIASPSPLIITKVSDKPIYGPNAPAVFTITFQNTGSYGVSLDKITDQLPAGFTFQSIDGISQVNDNNSVAVPAAGSTGQLLFEAGMTSNATSYYIPAGGTMILKYTAITSLAPVTNVETTVSQYIGNTLASSAQNQLSVSTTLPVHFLSFKGARADEKVRLEWTTAQEMSSHSFEVQRRNGNGEFTTIGIVAAAGTSSGNTSYSFTDVLPPSGTNHYRIKEVDIDSRYQYSNVVSILPERSIKTAKAFPNPFTDYTNVTISSGKAQTVRLVLSDMSGKTVWAKNESCIKGENTILLDPIGALKAGAYFLTIITEEGNYLEKILKN